MTTYDHDAVVIALAARASTQVREGLAALTGGHILEAEVHFRAAHATLSSLALLLETPKPPLRVLAIVGPRDEDADIQPWMTKKHNGGNDAA